MAIDDVFEADKGSKYVVSKTVLIPPDEVARSIIRRQCSDEGSFTAYYRRTIIWPLRAYFKDEVIRRENELKINRERRSPLKRKVRLSEPLEGYLKGADKIYLVLGSGNIINIGIEGKEGFSELGAYVRRGFR